MFVEGEVWYQSHGGLDLCGVDVRVEAYYVQ